MATDSVMYASGSVSDASPGQEATTAQVDAAVEAFKLLADGTRLRLLLTLADGSERAVTELCERVGVSHPLASQHLARLRRGGAVTARREERQVSYSLSGGHMRRLMTEALFHADNIVTGTTDHGLPRLP